MIQNIFCFVCLQHILLFLVTQMGQAYVSNSLINQWNSTLHNPVTWQASGIMQLNLTFDVIACALDMITSLLMTRAFRWYSMPMSTALFFSGLRKYDLMNYNRLLCKYHAPRKTEYLNLLGGVHIQAALMKNKPYGWINSRTLSRLSFTYYKQPKPKSPS